jgi:hypothetical protein
MGLEQVEFYMVGNNATVVQKRLDEIRAKGNPCACPAPHINRSILPSRVYNMVTINP